MRKTPDLQLLSSSRRMRLSWGIVFAGAVSGFLLAFFLGSVVEQQQPASSLAGTTHDKAPAFVQQRDQAAGRLTARVVGITDGDTMTVLSGEGEYIKVRLVEVDAPEADQPWGPKAKEALSKLTFGHDVEVRTAGTDQYGRLLGRVYSSGTDVNAEMIHAGNAWAYRDYLTDQSLLAVEAEARSMKRGLWALPANQAIPPWSWRRGQRPPRSVAGAPSSTRDTSTGDRQCAGKRYCRQMTSCAEARFYLNVCHVGSLDGDHDGIPCEDICGH